MAGKKKTAVENLKIANANLRKLRKELKAQGKPDPSKKFTGIRRDFLPHMLSHAFHNFPGVHKRSKCGTKELKGYAYDPGLLGYANYARDYLPKELWALARSLAPKQIDLMSKGEKLKLVVMNDDKEAELDKQAAEEMGLD